MLAWTRRTAHGGLALGGGVVALLAVLLWAGPAAAQQQPSGIFTVAAVPVDATAASALAARDAARREGERRAYGMLMDRLTLASDHARLPKPTNALLDRLVQSFEVANERSSAVRYLADYTFHFRPDAVRNLLRQSKIPFAETPSKPLLVLPVYQGDSGAVLWDDPNPWRATWGAKPLPRGLVPLVMPMGELEDVAAIDAAQAASGDDAHLQAISQHYGGADVLVARAAPRTSGGLHALDVTATRFDPGTPGGQQTWTDSYVATAGESDDDLMARAVAGTIAAVEEAWKTANILNFSQTGTLVVNVPIGDLQSWVAVRDRLSGIPAIQRSDLLALDRQAAQVALHFVGDPAQLRVALAQRDLVLSGDAPNWVLQRRGAAPRD